MVSAREPVQTLVRSAPVTIGEKLTLRAVAAVLTAEDIGVALVERGRRLHGNHLSNVVAAAGESL